MDSSITKFLEDDEDQTMHPEAAVEAFIPTLNSDIEENNNSKSQPHSIADAMKVPFGLLLSIIEPQLDKDRAIRLRCLYNRLKSNNINRNEFIPNIRTLVGKDMIKAALYKLQTQQMMQGPIHPNVAHEKPLEFSPSKKQKVCGAYSDQSIEQLDDVTSVSGVNLREEEEQLFSGSISQVSESSRKVVQEEERRLFLQRLPLQKKVAEIMAKCGVKNKSNGVERCLSWCVEERMHGLITNLIRLSKQRLDIEKPRHQTVITSDIGQQIMLLNRKAREEYEEKQPEVSGGDGDGKSSKVNKKKADKMRTAAANVAARMAVGGDDMLSKWQQQACKKRENGPTIRKSVRNRDLCQSGDNIQLPRVISLKDLISVLEREIQMSKSTLIYDLLCRSSFRFHV